MEKFKIHNKISDGIQFTAEINCDPNASDAQKKAWPCARLNGTTPI